MKLRVFVVEDAYAARQSIVDLLGSLGCFEIAGVADTEAEANLWLQDNRESWDLVIVDLVLATGSGMNVVRRAREVKSSGRVVVLTGYASPGITAHLFSLGADAVFDKAAPAAFSQWIEGLCPPDAGAADTAVS